MIGNGDTLTSSGKCANIILDIQGHLFSLDLFVLPIRGADIVLVIQWLQLLGDVYTNYSTFVMKSEWLRKTIHLQGQSNL